MNLSNKQKNLIKLKCASYTDVDPEKLEDKFQEALLNEYVDHYSNGRLTYTRDFYKDMYKQIEKGKTYVEAYKALGFNVKALGEDRANSAGKRAVQMAEDGSLYKAQIGDYPGTIPMEKMQGLKKEGLDKYIAYLEGRCLYLQAAIDVEKEKKRSSYQERRSRSKKAEDSSRKPE